jgi:hypothetical protein
MKNHFRILYKLLPKSVGYNAYARHFRQNHEDHLANQLPGVSHWSKQQFLKKWAKDFGAKILVETGTYLGDMLFMLMDDFEKLYSIELSEFFHHKAKRRFANNHKIELLFGDSGKELAALIPKLKDKTLFWLDGHYSGGKTALGQKECPIFEELQHIFTVPAIHLLIIDDARLFVGANSYPTIKELTEYIVTTSEYKVKGIENDAIIVIPK